MITSFQIYLILMLDNIKIISIIFSLVFGSVIILSGIFLVNEVLDKDELKYMAKVFKYSILGIILCLLSAMFIPNTKQVAAIILIPKIINNEKIQNIGQNSLDTVDKLMKLSNDYIQNKFIIREE